MVVRAMANDGSVDDRTSVSVALHPQLEAFLKAQSVKSGRSLQAEIIQVIGEAMEAAEIPPAPTDSRFVCTEALMAQKAAGPSKGAAKVRIRAGCGFLFPTLSGN
jgi:hypothetical protein